MYQCQLAGQMKSHNIIHFSINIDNFIIIVCKRSQSDNRCMLFTRGEEKVGHLVLLRIGPSVRLDVRHGSSSKPYQNKG